MKNINLFIGIIVIGILIFIGWKINDNKKESYPGGVVTIGAILSQTGFAAPYGEMGKKGIALAVEEINKDGGINGKQVILKLEDDRTDAKSAVSAYKKLTSIDGVGAIIGSNFDFVTKPLFDLAKEQGTVVITPMTSPIAGAIETNKNSFSMLIEFSDVIRKLSPYLDTVSYKKMAVIHYSSSFGEEISKTLNTLSVEKGKGAVVDEKYTVLGQTDWKPIILKLKSRGVDMVFADMLSDDFIRFVVNSRDLGFTPKFVTHNDVREALNKKDVDLSVLENVVVLNWDVLGSDKFVANFKNKYGVVPKNHASQAYVATYILAEAISKNGKDGLSKYLEENTFDTPEGKYDFTEKHTVTEMPIKIQIIKGGRLVDMK